MSPNHQSKLRTIELPQEEPCNITLNILDRTNLSLNSTNLVT